MALESVLVKCCPRLVRSATLNMQSCFNSLHSNHDLGMSLRCRHLTSGTQSIANGPVHRPSTAITACCQGSRRARKNGKSSLTFKTRRSRPRNSGSSGY